MIRNHQDLQNFWHQIDEAGGIDRYIHQQLIEKGFLIERRLTDQMNQTELARYKAQLKREASEKRLLRQQAWQAYRATHIVSLGDHIYWSDDTSADQFDLKNAEKRLLDNQLPAFKRVEELAAALDVTIPQLRGLCFHRDAAPTSLYRRFEIPKRSGGMREIWAPKPLLKRCQHWILNHILNQMLIHGAAHGFVRGRSIATNAAMHQDSEIIIKIDIQDFFPTVHWKRIKGVFRKAGYHEQIATLLALLCTEAPRKVITHEGETLYIALKERCLPQGAPTSPALTNIICLNLDRRLTGMAAKLGWRYTRYADDMTFSLPNGTSEAHIGALLGAVHKILREEGFILHPSKTHVIRRQCQQTVTGLVVNESVSPRVPRLLKRQLRAALHNLEQGKPLPAGESLERLQGYCAFIAMTEPALGRDWLNRLAIIRQRHPALSSKLTY